MGIKILDITAGYRKMWQTDKALLPEGEITFLDKRPEVKPDIVGDNEHLPDELAGRFDYVVYDPPHAIDKRKTLRWRMKDNYSWWNNAADLIHNVVCVNQEASKVLKPTGQLILKYCEIYREHAPTERNPSLGSILKCLDNFSLLSKVTFPSRSGSKNQTYYVWLVKKEAAKK